MLVLPDRHTKSRGMGRGCGGLLEQHLQLRCCSSCMIASWKHSGALRPDKAASLLCIPCLHSNTHQCKLLVNTAATDNTPCHRCSHTRASTTMVVLCTFLTTNMASTQPVANSCSFGSQCNIEFCLNVLLLWGLLLCQQQAWRLCCLL